MKRFRIWATPTFLIIETLSSLLTDTPRAFSHPHALQMATSAYRGLVHWVCHSVNGYQDHAILRFSLLLLHVLMVKCVLYTDVETHLPRLMYNKFNVACPPPRLGNRTFQCLRRPLHSPVIASLSRLSQRWLPCWKLFTIPLLAS